MLPVLIIAFNRPDLFIHIDGPRVGNFEDKRLIDECERVIEISLANQEYVLMKRDANLGPQLAVPAAIDWFFSQVKSGAIIEDDIVVHPDALNFISIGLERYEFDSGVGALSLYNTSKLQKVLYRHPGNFVSIVRIWGWATWKDRWSLYRSDPSFDNLDLRLHHLSPIISRTLMRNLKSWMKNPETLASSWDTQLTYELLVNQKAIFISSRCLSENIGFDKRATRTAQVKNRKMYSGSLRHLKINDFPSLQKFTKAREILHFISIWGFRILLPQKIARFLISFYFALTKRIRFFSAI
jgi:hypothetical protein